MNIDYTLRSRALVGDLRVVAVPQMAAAAQLVVGAAVAGHPAREFGMRVSAAGGVDVCDILRVLHKLDDQPVGRVYSCLFGTP